MRRFELSEGKSNKFWEVSREGASVTVRFGRIGTTGQNQTKAFDDEPKAKAELEKLVKEKTKKGYSEIAAKDEPAPASSPAAEAASEAPDEASPAAAPAAPAPPAPAPKPVAPKRPSAPTAAAAPAAARPVGDGFLAAGNGYALTLREGKLVARNPKGQLLGAVPKDVKDSDVGEQLQVLVEWLAAHARACIAWTDDWMLRSLPVPAAVVTAVWQDEAYRIALENLVVFAVAADGSIDRDRGGMLRGSAPDRGIGVVDRDGETAWLDAAAILVPHPILIDALDDWRALATELAFTQGTQQLFREVFARDADTPKDARAVLRFQGGAFKQLNHAIGTAKTLGYRVSGGSATTRVLEQGRTIEARYWIGDGDPQMEAMTGGLAWVDDKQTEVALAAVTPIAFSEGMRMASSIFAKRVIEEKKEGV